MRKLTALIIALLLVLNLFSSFVFAVDVTVHINDIDYGVGRSAFDIGDSVTIRGTCTAKKDLVLRLYDEKGAMIYTDVIYASDNDGNFEFSGIVIPDTASTGTLPYKAYISITENSSPYNKDIYINGKPIPPSPNPGPGPAPQPTTNPIVCAKCGWETCTCEEPEENPDPAPTGAPIPVENYPIIEEAAKVPTAKAGEAMIHDVTQATAPEALAGEATRNTIAMSVEAMMANISSKKISTASSSNKLVLKASSVSDSDLKKYTDTEKTLNDALNKNKITLNRELTKEYIVNTTFSTSKKANITIYKGFVTKLEKIGIETLTINDKNFRVSYSMAELQEMIGDDELTTFDIDTTAMTGSSKKLSVNFNTDKTQTVKISFPGLKGDSKYMAIVDANGNPVGGRYNPATGAIEAKITESGVYQIVNNEKDFDDIKHLSDEMQESIKILAAKGIIEGTSAKEFSPEDSISRAEVAALLLRVLAQVDPNADGGFDDVKKSDWFYGTAGSAKAYGMIQGFEDNTFRGNQTIAKDQILTIASRVLQREMKYIAPENPEEWLSFADASGIADWAQKDIALTSMANIITRTADNTIHATEDMTRGDASLIIMRLFYKIW